MPELPFDQVDAGDTAGHVGALRQVRRGGIALLQAELVGHSVLVEDVGYALHFAGR